MVTRNWFPGMLGKTGQGEFVVTRETNTGYLVEYTSGKWEGKFIEMPREVSKPTQTLEGLKLPKDKKEEFLDLFYSDYPQEYLGVHRQLEGVRYSTPTTDETIVSLRSAYPPLFQLTLNKFFQSQK